MDWKIKLEEDAFNISDIDTKLNNLTIQENVNTPITSYKNKNKYEQIEVEKKHKTGKGNKNLYKKQNQNYSNYNNTCYTNNYNYNSNYYYNNNDDYHYYYKHKENPKNSKNIKKNFNPAINKFDYYYQTNTLTQIENKTQNLAQLKNKSKNLLDDYSSGINININNSLTLVNASSDKKQVKELPKKMLCVDILNFSLAFFDRLNHMNLTKPTKKIKQFIIRCRKEGYEPVIFIDGCNITEETQKKWADRRENEVKSGVRGVPQNMNLLFFELFRENGVEVHFSYEADNDDTLAAYADFYDGCVLSRDRDFLRYKNYKYEIFRGFEFNGNRIYFDKQTHRYPKFGVEFRDLITPLPKTTQKWEEFMIHKTNDPNTLLYRRGAPSAFIKIFGNPHVKVRLLRQALFHKIQIKEMINEVFPHWDTDKNQFVWYENISQADNKFEEMLSKPYEAVEYFMKDLLVKPKNIIIKENEWLNHIQAVHTVVYEICSISMKKPLISILRQSPHLKHSINSFD